MTQKTVHVNEHGQQGKTPGWFSWRHKTSDAHEEARATYLANHGPESRREVATARTGEVKTWLCGHRSARRDHPCSAVAR